jgi:hypothetical protein
MAHMRIVGALAAALVILLSGCWLDDEESADGPSAYRDDRVGIEASIPAGWQVIEKPINAVTYPRQVLAAASFPVRTAALPQRGCGAEAVLEQMPRDGALLQIIEYDPGELPDLPARPDRFTYANRGFANYECAGPSFQFSFSDHDRAFQARITLNRRAVHPRIRAQAIEILNGFRPGQPASAGALAGFRSTPDGAVVRCSTATLGAGSAAWRDESTHVGRLGFFGDERDFRTATGPSRGRWMFVVKTPLIVEGSRPVTVAIAPADRQRAALAFRVGGSLGAYAELRFVPCGGRARTAWPGGFFLKDRQPVQVLVREHDGTRSHLVVGRVG